MASAVVASARAARPNTPLGTSAMGDWRLHQKRLPVDDVDAFAKRFFDMGDLNDGGSSRGQAGRKKHAEKHFSEFISHENPGDELPLPDTADAPLLALATLPLPTFGVNDHVEDAGIGAGRGYMRGSSSTAHVAGTPVDVSPLTEQHEPLLLDFFPALATVPGIVANALNSACSQLFPQLLQRMATGPKPRTYDIVTGALPSPSCVFGHAWLQLGLERAVLLQFLLAVTAFATADPIADIMRHDPLPLLASTPQEEDSMDGIPTLNLPLAPQMQSNAPKLGDSLQLPNRHSRRATPR